MLKGGIPSYETHPHGVENISPETIDAIAQFAHDDVPMGAKLRLTRLKVDVNDASSCQAGQPTVIGDWIRKPFGWAKDDSR